MNAAWKPGDVALRGDEAVVFTDERQWLWATTGLPCIDQTGDDCRPAALIDPEDREAVERLRVALLSTGRPGGIAALGQHETVQAALREFANPTPPKPDEPTGLGAVVEAEDGSILTRISLGGGRDWVTIHGTPFEWSEIDVARIVGSGVQP